MSEFERRVHCFLGALEGISVQHGIVLHGDFMEDLEGRKLTEYTTQPSLVLGVETIEGVVFDGPVPVLAGEGSDE